MLGDYVVAPIRRGVSLCQLQLDVVSIVTKCYNWILDVLAKFCRHLAGPHDIGAAYGEIQKAAIDRKVKVL
jgi:hypothetical protein